MQRDVHRNVRPSVLRGVGFWFALVAVVLCTTGRPARAADPRAEREAQALQKAAIEEDNLNVDYPAAIRKLQTALTKCGADRCSPALKARLTRDLGAMQALGGSPDDAKASFGRALQLDPSLDLDPAYKNPMLEGLWNDVKSSAGATPATPAAPAGAAPSTSQPPGDFVHTPPPEGRVRTPLAIYAEYAGTEPIARVLVKYKSASMADWTSLDLKKVGEGFGVLIPCKDATQGTLQYFIQGFDAQNQPVAMSGSRNAPFTVEITPQISGPPPSLPGRPPPSPCDEAPATAVSECPPDFPGCNEPKKENGAACSQDRQCDSGSCRDGKCAEKKGTGDACASDAECSSDACVEGSCSDRKGAGAYCERDADCASDTCTDSKCGAGGSGSGYRRLWIGVAADAAFYVMPGATTACKLNAAGNRTINSANYNCVDPPPANTNFPGASGRSVNDAINSGNVQSGVAFGNVRILASLDYAVTSGMLVGIRGGYVLGTDPATGKPGAAFAPVHLEARLTYLFGRAPLVHQTISALVLGGVGVGEFDAFVPVTVGFNNSMVPQKENAWLTAGPAFLTAGVGLRLRLGSRAAATAAVKLDAAFGGTAGFLFGFAPELGVQFGL